MRCIWAIILSFTLLTQAGRAGEQARFKEQKARNSYSLGYEFGSNLKRQGVEIDLEVLLPAVQEGLENKKPALSPEQMGKTLKQLRKTLMILQERRLHELAAKNLEEGKAFLEANKTKEGVEILPSGLQYKVLKEGSGASPKMTDRVTVNYRGTLINGEEFDSSYAKGKPAGLTVGGVVEGWREALQLMKTGSKWQIFVPSELAYSKRYFGRIPPNSVLIFDLELLSINGDALSKSSGPE